MPINPYSSCSTLLIHPPPRFSGVKRSDMQVTKQHVNACHTCMRLERWVTQRRVAAVWRPYRARSASPVLRGRPVTSSGLVSWPCRDATVLEAGPAETQPTKSLDYSKASNAETVHATKMHATHNDRLKAKVLANYRTKWRAERLTAPEATCTGWPTTAGRFFSKPTRRPFMPV